MARPAKGAVIADQELPTPDAAVGPVARPVEGNPDYRLNKAMLGHTTGHVRVVVLDGNRRPRTAVLPRVSCRGIIGVQIMDQELRPEIEKPLVMRDRFPEGPEGCVMVEIADVVAEERVMAPAEGDRRLELAAQGDGRHARLHRQGQRSGRIAARAANR